MFKRDKGSGDLYRIIQLYNKTKFNLIINFQMSHVFTDTGLSWKNSMYSSLNVCSEKFYYRHFGLLGPLSWRDIRVTYNKILRSNVYIESNLFGNLGIRKGD